MTKKLEVKRETWDKEFLSGRWNCLDENPTERARHAVIGMYCRKYFPNGKILDVGCGEGTLTDFLNDTQKQNYLGIDLSKEAIRIGSGKRTELKFRNIEAETFETDQKLDIIVFNEVLYYTEHERIFKKYSELLEPDGIVILSLYRRKNKIYNIFDIIENLRTGSGDILKKSKEFFTSQEFLEILGKIEKKEIIWRVEVMKKIY
jgi:2-polyprenyl-3-methyl-5-hydroxy-6-metoxy-1,4-benzoquinol methylase